MNENLLRIFAVLLICCISIQYGYAQTEKTIIGKISDASGEAMIGVSVSVEGTSLGATTDFEGKFSFNVPADKASNAVLLARYLGYSDSRQVIGDNTHFDIILQEDVQRLDEVIVVGYGSQKKANLVGAVSAITSDKLISTKNQNVQNMLTGKLPGVRVMQKTSEPGNLDNVFDIRGFGTPLIIVDGASMGMAEFQRIDPSDIESVSVLKDASAAIYGVRSSNGVVLIQTKRGNIGKPSIEYSMYYGFQSPSENLKPANAYDRAILYNEKYKWSNPTTIEMPYSDEDLEKMRNGEIKTYDWYDAVLRSAAPQQQHNISMRGGTEKVEYYLNLGYLKQDGLFRNDDMSYGRYNLRSNVDVQVFKDLKVGVRLSGSLDDRDRPQQDAWTVFKALWRTPTTLNIYANDNPAYPQQVDGSNNAVVLTNADLTGYKENKRKNMNVSFDATYTIPFVKGLSAKTLFNYDNTTEDNTNFLKQYDLYNYSGSGTYDAITYEKINTLTRSSYNSGRRTWNVSLNYKNTFNSVHSVDASLVYEENYEEGYGFTATRELQMPLPYLDLGNDVQRATGGAPGEYANKGLIGRLNYSYDSRYLLDASFRYDGSSRFLPNKQWDLFYSVLGAWRISEEKFIKENVNFINNLKLRASYGRLGDDSANMYEFLGGYNYGTSGGASNNYPKVYYLGTGFVTTLTSRATPNANIGWLDITNINLGLDVDLWGGLFGTTFEVFQRTREGLYGTRAAELPLTFGASMPQENLGSDRNKGFEVELRHRNKINDFKYELSGHVAITRTMVLEKVHTPYKNSYDEWKNTQVGRYSGVWFLYGDGGRVQSYEQRATFPYAIDQYSLPGDYIREDWNNDGIIDDADMYPLAIKGDDNGNSRPLANFAISANFAWKGFDLDFMFQGSALGYVVYGEQLAAPLAWDGNALPHFLDRWHPVDPKVNPRDPSTEWVSGEYRYGARGTEDNSMFGIQNGAYLRLKTATLGYTLPKPLLAKAGIANVRFYVNGYNLFTITGVEALDPERPNDQSGSVYPITRTINIGAQIKF